MAFLKSPLPMILLACAASATNCTSAGTERPLPSQASPPAKIAADTSFHPLVDMKSKCLLGGVKNGQYVDSDAAAPLIKGGERYKLYSLKEMLGDGIGPTPSAEGPPCEGTTDVDVSPAPSGGNESIAVGGEWNALPRRSRELSTSEAVYRAAVADVLKEKGISKATVNLNQILRVDLDGDGVDEVLVSANHHPSGISPNSAAGEYAIIFLRKLIQGKVATIPLDSDFHLKAEEDASPVELKIAAVLDLDGDGVMEVLLRSHYHEGEYLSAYRVAGNRAAKVLTCGCGL